MATIIITVEKQIASQDLGLIGWRTLPVDNSELGPTSLESEPHSEMLLVAPQPGLATSDFPRELYKLRILSAAAMRHDPQNDDFYFNSLNSSTIVRDRSFRDLGDTCGMR